MIFEPRDAKSGDIVRIKIGSIYHYGIFVSEEEVIQFGYPPVGAPHAQDDILVCVTDIDEFSAGFIVEVGVLDKKEKKTAKKTKEIISFARSRIGSGGYNLVHNNCEHFVNECVFGKKISYQEIYAREKWKNRKVLDVYISKIPEDVTDFSVFPKAREDEILSVSHDNLKKQKLWVWKVLEYAIFRSFSYSMEELAPTRDKSGKWVSEKCFFSLSHTKDLVSVAVSNEPVGVDIENVVEFKTKFQGKDDLVDKIVEKICTKKEKKDIKTLDFDEIVALWTKKESVFKSKDKTVFEPKKLELTKEKVVTKFDSLEDIAYCVSVCGENTHHAKYFVYER